MKTHKDTTTFSLEKANATLRQQLDEKITIISDKEQTVSALLTRVNRLEEQNRLLLHRLYSARSEKLKQDDNASRQLSLFDEASALIPQEPEAETPTTEIKGHQRKKGGGRRPLPKKFVRI